MTQPKKLIEVAMCNYHYQLWRPRSFHQTGSLSERTCEAPQVPKQKAGRFPERA